MKFFFPVLHAAVSLIVIISMIAGLDAASGKVELLPLYLLYLAVILLPLVFIRHSKNPRLIFLSEFICMIPGLILFFLFPAYGAVYLLPFHVCRLVFLFNRFYKFALYIIPLFFLLFISSDLYVLFLSISLICAGSEIYVSQSRKKHMRLWSMVENLQKENDQVSDQLQISRLNKQLEVYYENLEDRSKLAQKLHDEVGHTLTASIYQLQAAARIQEQNPEKAAAMHATVIEVLQKGMYSIRATLRNLRPADSELGLEHIKSTLATFSSNNGIKATVSVEGDIKVLDFSYWKDISINVQELLTNCLRYSDADECQLLIAVLPGIIKVAFKDNGKGATKIVPGMGLKGIEKRVAGMSGRTVFDGSSGFSVIMLYQREVT